MLDQAGESTGKRDVRKRESKSKKMKEAVPRMYSTLDSEVSVKHSSGRSTQTGRIKEVKPTIRVAPKSMDVIIPQGVTGRRKDRKSKEKDRNKEKNGTYYRKASLGHADISLFPRSQTKKVGAKIKRSPLI